MSFSQRFWSLFRTDHRYYQEAYSKYEAYSRELGLTLLGPTVDQIALARGNPLIGQIEALYDQAMEASKTAGLSYNVGVVLYQKGLLRRLIGDNAGAQTFFRQALQFFDKTLSQTPSARSSISMCNFYLGQSLLRTGCHEEAKKHLRTAIALDQALRYTRRIAAAESMLVECGRQGP